MYTPRLFGIAALVGLAACAFERPPPIEDPDAGAAGVDDALDGPIGETAAIAVTWSIVDGYTGDGDSAGACPADVMAKLLATSAGQPAHERVVDCAAGAGAIADLALGTYDVAVELVDSAGTRVHARSATTSVTLLDADEPVDADLDIDAYNGFVTLAWTVSPGGCEATEVVSVLSTIGTTGVAREDIALCTQGEAPAQIATMALPVGDVTMAVALLNANGEAVGSAPAAQASIAIANQPVDGGEVVIARD